MLPPKKKRKDASPSLPAIRKFGHCLTFPSAEPPPPEESKPLIQDLTEPIPKVHYLEDQRFSHEHNIVALAGTLIFLALAGIAVVFTVRRDDEKPPVYAAVPGGLPPQEAAPDSPDKITKKAIRAFLSGEKDRAKQLLAGVDLAQAASPLAWELEGMLKEDAGDNRAAMETYSQGIAVAPSEWLFYRRANLHRASGEFDLALEDMDRATAIPSVHALISNERLLLLIQMGRQDQVRAELQALDARKAEPSSWIFGLCGMALQDGDYQKAGRLLASGKQSVDRSIFDQILKNPVISRYQTRPELMPFFFSNLPKK